MELHSPESALLIILILQTRRWNALRRKQIRLKSNTTSIPVKLPAIFRISTSGAKLPKVILRWLSYLKTMCNLRPGLAISSRVLKTAHWIGTFCGFIQTSQNRSCSPDHLVQNTPSVPWRKYPCRQLPMRSRDRRPAIWQTSPYPFICPLMRI